MDFRSQLVDNGTTQKDYQTGYEVIMETRETFLTRRGFLQQGAAALGSSLIAATALRSAAQAAPSERLTVGFIGTGKRAHTLLRKLIQFPEAQVIAVAEVEGIRRDHAKASIEKHYAATRKTGRFRGCDAYVDFRELLARDDIDAVVVATPDHWHAIPVVEAAKLGKDIYCEKPLSLTIGEAHVMAKTVKKHNVVFQTGSQQRSEFDGRFHRACELVRNGRIGRVHTVLISVGDPSGDCDLPAQEVPPDTDWDRWLGPAPWRSYNEALCPKGMHTHFPLWRLYKDYSGGMMTDWGAHQFDIAQWGLGMDESGPVEIFAPDGDRKRISYRYASGVIMHHGRACRGVKFIGEDGWVEVNRRNLWLHPEELAEEKIGENEIQLYKADNHIGNWLECVRSRKQPICPAEVGARTAAVCHLGNLAYWHGRDLQWNPEKWEFVGDPEANGWLNRPQRAPWKLEV